MLIEPVLGYKSSWRILDLLLETPRKPVNRRELLQLTKLGNAPLSRGLDRLQRCGFLVLEKKGKKEFYYINEKDEGAKLVQELWKRELAQLRNLPYPERTVLNEFLRSLNDNYSNISSVILFGSHAKGTASIHSDLDLSVVFNGEFREVEITKIVRKIEKQFGRKIQVHSFEEKSFALGKTALIQEIKRDGIVLT